MTERNRAALTVPNGGTSPSPPSAGQASANGGRSVRPLRTTRERAVRARADDRNRGRKRAQTGARVERLLIVLSVAERTPPPPGRPSGHARPMRGRRAADARRHAIGLLDIGVLPEAPMVVLNQQPAPRRARRDDLIALPTTWVIARIAARATSAPARGDSPTLSRREGSTHTPARRGGQASGGRLTRRRAPPRRARPSRSTRARCSNAGVVCPGAHQRHGIH